MEPASFGSFFLSRKSGDLVPSQLSAYVSDTAPGRGALRTARSWLHSDGGYVAANAVSHKWALQTIKWLRDQNKAEA